MTMDLRLQLLVPARPALWPVVEEAVRGGVTLVQLREKELPDGPVLEAGASLRDTCRRLGACFVVDDRVDVALALEADGVHVGQQDLPLGAVRSVVGGRLQIGVSTHDVRQIAAADGAAYIGFGPVFPTDSKADAEEPRGLAGVREAVAAARSPVVAIGGIDLDNAGQLRGSGIAGVAVIRAILAAADPQEAAYRLRRALALD